MNFLETEKNDDSFAYFDVQNLSIDHSLIMSEIEEYKDLIFSPNSLHQIYFKENANLDTIEIIKNLLSISEYINDSKIDKIILLNLDDEEIKVLLESTYENPSTWQLPYEYEDDKYTLTDIPNFRTMNTFIKKLIDKDLSPIEQVMKIYDQIKLMDYEQNDEIIQLPEIILKKKANSYGMNKLFSYILSKQGFKTFVAETMIDNNKSYVTLVEIKDEKYNLDGIYLFDPSMDTLSKNDYKSESIRRINYNFFALSLQSMKKLNYDERLLNILSILAIDDCNYSKEKLENSKSKIVNLEAKKLIKLFNEGYEKIHQRIKDTKNIDIDTIIRINDVLYSSKKEKYNEYLRNNFYSRKQDLFIKETEEEIEELINEEKNK